MSRASSKYCSSTTIHAHTLSASHCQTCSHPPSAGITDSALTNHGVAQADRLAQHLAKAGVCISHVFSSDLQRAFKTAEAIRVAQGGRFQELTAPVTRMTPLLREQDFGFYEGKKFFERSKGSNKLGQEAHSVPHKNDLAFVDVESRESMQVRCDMFIDKHLLDIIWGEEEKHSVVVVAHGIILNHLWRCILRRCNNATIRNLEITMDERIQSLEHLGSWSNTGYLELELLQSRVKAVGVRTTDLACLASDTMETVLEMRADDLSTPTTTPVITGTTKNEVVRADLGAADSEATSPERAPRRSLSNFSLVVHRVNCVSHLKNLKKTRGGIGSLKHDETQKSIESFFKKRKIG